MSEFSVKTSDFVNVLITTSCDDKVVIERRFPKGITVSNLKGKLEMVTGASEATMTVKVYDIKDKFICALDDNNKLFGFYPVDDGMRLHVEDRFDLKKQLDSELNVEKFELSNEDYSKRPDSLHAYLKMNKIGKYDEEANKKRELDLKRQEELELEQIKTLPIGSRCQISVPGQPVRRGCVKYAGKVQFTTGNWIGVQYDEPLGKNDGSVQDVRYFECPPKYGGFVKPEHVEAGDFPEEEINFDDEM